MIGPRVIEVLPGRRAIVSTEGCRRVKLTSGRIVGELMGEEAAGVMVDTLKGCGVSAESVDYEALASSASN